MTIDLITIFGKPVFRCPQYLNFIIYVHVCVCVRVRVCMCMCVRVCICVRVFYYLWIKDLGSGIYMVEEEQRTK